MFERLEAHFSPVEHTPWAGTLLARLKNLPQTRLGASLEVDVASSSYRFQIKWLHAESPLSIQVHPPLQQGGKVEAWIVMAVDPAPEAQLYLGLRNHITVVPLQWSAHCLFAYKPKVGDVILIPPGLVHSLGPGILVVEPQFFLHSAKTLRLWDWGRQGRRLDEEAWSFVDLHLPRENQFLMSYVNQFDRCPFKIFMFQNRDEVEQGFSAIRQADLSGGYICLMKGRLRVQTPTSQMILESGYTYHYRPYALCQVQVDTPDPDIQGVWIRPNEESYGLYQ